MTATKLYWTEVGTLNTPLYQCVSGVKGYVCVLVEFCLGKGRGLNRSARVSVKEGGAVTGREHLTNSLS